jgi:hypothetical protein
MALVVDGGGLVNKGGALGTGAACCCGGCGSVAACTVAVSWNGNIVPVQIGGALNSSANCVQVYECGFYYEYAANDPYPEHCPRTLGGSPAPFSGGFGYAEMCVHRCGIKTFGPGIDPASYDFYVDISTFFGAVGGLNQTNKFAFRFSGRQAVSVFADTTNFSCEAIAAVADQAADPTCQTRSLSQCECDYSPPTVSVTCPP